MGQTDKKDSVLSFIGSDIEVKGNIAFNKSLRVDGAVTGKITSDTGSLVVGQTARIKGDIKVGSITVMGTVTGKIIARDRVDAFPPAKIKGNILAPVIGLEKGVEFSGNCEIIPKHAIK